MSDQEKLPEIDPNSVENFPLDNPKAKIVRDRGRIRVVERDYYWDKEKKRGLEKRRYLGMIVDGRFYDTELYAKLCKRSGARRLVPKPSEESPLPVSALETKLAAEFPLYYEAARATGLIGDLTAVWGKERAEAVLSIAFHWLNTANNASYLYDSWSEGKLLPYCERITAKEMTTLFESLAGEPGWRKSFFRARISKLPENEILSFDATQIASDAEEVTYAQYGKGKEGSYQTQVGLIVLLGHRTRMPVLFRILPGNITDVTTVQDMLFRFDEINDSRRVFAAVLDRGYCSLDNLAQFIDRQSRVIVAAKTSYRWVQESIKEVLPRLWLNETRISGQQCWGATHSLLHRFPDGKSRRMWVHVYRSDLISHTENTRFYSSLEAFETQWNSCKKSGNGNESALLKSPLLKYYKKMSGKQLQPGIDELVRDDWAIDQAVRYFGCFCNVTTFPCTAADALLEYTLRDSIEKCFKAGKSCVELDTIRSHNDQTTEGRFVVSFCCMTILNELHRRMKLETYATVGTDAGKLPPLAKEMTWNEIRNYMSGIRMVYDGKGGRRWMEITRRQHAIAERLGFPNAYRKLPEWGPE